MQWTGCMPKEYRCDVPVLPGNARGDAFDAWQGKFVEGDDQWTMDGGDWTVFGLWPFDRQIVESAAVAVDSCLAGKGCKAECPSGVDMAKLKYAFQEDYYKTHRRQLRDYVFGYFHIAAGLASAVAPLSNGLMES